MFSQRFTFTAQLWRWSAQSKGSWFFVTVPEEISVVIKRDYPLKLNGFGSIPVEVECGSEVWKTSLFPDSKSGCYVLPIKSAVRKNLGVSEGNELNVTVTVSA